MPGFTVGGYHLLTRIGEGGMGVVHLAQRPGGPRVALKVLRPHIVGDDEARARLAREVNSLSRIRSTGVAEIVDADPWGDIPYVATRYVPGLSLHDHVREEGPITGPDLTWFATRLGEGLLSVHEQGVLHRDVKPSNVLMEGRTPILIDFGLARVADDPKLTHTGWLLGTPGYLAPEILHGDDATAASDVHSWAATVAFAGTGRPPFGRGPSMAVMDRVRRGEHALDGLPDDVRRVVAAALDPDPRRRPTLPEAIHRLRSGALPAAPPRAAVPGRRRRLHRPAGAWRRSPTPTTSPTHGSHLGRRPARSHPGRADRARPVGAAPGLGSPRGHRGGPPPRPSLAVRTRTTLLLLAAGAGRRRRHRGLPLPRHVRAGPRRLAAPQRFAGGQRGQPPAAAARPAPVVRRPAAAAGRSLAPGPVDPRHLMLTLWGIGLATAAALFGYAFGLGLTWTLFACGVAFLAGLWIGPGGSRVRGPVLRVVGPVTARPGAWLVTTVLLLAAASLASYSVDAHGPDWAPADDHLFAGFSPTDLLPAALR